MKALKENRGAKKVRTGVMVVVTFMLLGYESPVPRVEQLWTDQEKSCAVYVESEARMVGKYMAPRFALEACRKFIKRNPYTKPWETGDSL